MHTLDLRIPVIAGFRGERSEGHVGASPRAQWASGQWRGNDTVRCWHGRGSSSSRLGSPLLAGNQIQEVRTAVYILLLIPRARFVPPCFRGVSVCRSSIVVKRCLSLRLPVNFGVEGETEVSRSKKARHDSAAVTYRKVVKFTRPLIGRYFRDGKGVIRGPFQQRYTLPDRRSFPTRKGYGYSSFGFNHTTAGI